MLSCSQLTIKKYQKSNELSTMKLKKSQSHTMQNLKVKGINLSIKHTFKS